LIFPRALPLAQWLATYGRLTLPLHSFQVPRAGQDPTFVPLAAGTSFLRSGPPCFPLSSVFLVSLLNSNRFGAAWRSSVPFSRDDSGAIWSDFPPCRAFLVTEVFIRPQAEERTASFPLSHVFVRAGLFS